jgi:hypothetical protein
MLSTRRGFTGGCEAHIRAHAGRVPAVGAAAREYVLKALAWQPAVSRSLGLPADSAHYGLPDQGASTVSMRAYLGRLSPVVLGLPRNGKAPRLSAYAFRHALVTDLRDEGRTTEEIAAVIGELSAETVAYYGLHRRGRGKFRPRVAIERDSVQTADAVKPLNRSGLQAVLDKKAQSSSKLKPRLA